MVRWLLLFVLGALARANERTVVALARGGKANVNATDGFCLPDEMHRINAVITEASVVVQRKLREEERRLDPMWYCCSFCEEFWNCATAQPACKKAPYTYGVKNNKNKWEECPPRGTYRRALATIDALEDKIDTLEGAIDVVKSNIVNLFDRIERNQQRIEELNPTKKNYETRKNNLEIKIISLEEKLAIKQKKLVNKMQKLEQKTDKLENKQDCKEKKKLVRAAIKKIAGDENIANVSDDCRNLWTPKEVRYFCPP